MFNLAEETKRLAEASEIERLNSKVIAAEKDMKIAEKQRDSSDIGMTQIKKKPSFKQRVSSWFKGSDQIEKPMKKENLTENKKI